MTAHNHGRVSPFGHPRINAQLATPRGITQPLTSFIGSLCQGIHRAPFTDNTKTFIKMTRDHKHDQKSHTIKKILASTIQFSNNTTANHTNTQTTQQAARHHCDRPVPGACCSRHPTDATNHKQPCRTPQDRVNLKKNSDPGMISTRIQQTRYATPLNRCWRVTKKLLRKEVIQPHLPVRLPCYDFVPIADPTFDSSLTSLGHWLRVLPTFMT